MLLEHGRDLHLSEGEVSECGEAMAAALAKVPDLTSTLLDLPKAERR